MAMERPVFQDPPERGRVLLRDGSVAEVRPLTEEDQPVLRALLERQDEETRRLRFFATRSVAQDLATLLESGRVDGGFALVVTRGTPSEIVAVGSFTPLPDQPQDAEVAFLVDQRLHGHGLGTALLERLALIADRRGVRRFRAFVRQDNQRMLDVFRSSGLDVDVHQVADYPQELEVTLALRYTARTLSRFDERDRLATVASLLPFFHPRAIAVVGASRDRSSIGRRIFDNLVRQGFEGPVYPVNPHAAIIPPVAAYRSAAELPDDVDLAVVAVPSQSVPEVVEDLGRRGIKSAVVITAGFAETGEEGRRLQESLLKRARALGVRLVGPNCLGIVNTAPDVSMNASFAPYLPPPGRVAMSSQSGALGLALLDYASQEGLGISSFVSVGNKADVSGNDLLQYWEQDPLTDVIVLYLESFGNPRRFARLARRVGRTKPVLVVKAARTPAGTRAAASHTAAMASSETAVAALFQQTGVIRADTLQELFEVASLLVRQPLPRGRRVAVVTNAGGPGILATDALAAGGLSTPPPSPALRASLRASLPPEASLGNPFDMIASASADAYRAVLRAVAASHEYDALLVIFIPVLPEESGAVLEAISAEARSIREREPQLTMLGCVMAEGSPRVLSAGGAEVPLYRFPEAAARALAAVTRYAEWRAEPEGTLAEPPDVDLDAAQAVVAQAGDGWLDAPSTSRLLAAFGLPLLPLAWARTAEEAAAAARRFAQPVALKIASRTLIHKSEIGGVRLGLTSPEAVYAACQEIEESLEASGRRHELDGFLVQPMAPDGVECMLGVSVDPTFGPLVAFGLGGTEVEVLQDVVFRVLPLSDRDVEGMLSGLRGHRLLAGFRGRPPVDRAALYDAILRVALLADRLPEVQELDLNPVLALPEGKGVLVVDARVRIGKAG
jgi:acetyl coenzyme A synthetase (ADP forming)-like protein